MGRGDDADVDAHGPLAADADDLAVLHDAQQAHLRGGRELADLVQEQRPAVGLLEPALAPRVTAPVNAPCSWPNSSESISSGEIAPQFTRRNGPARNGECSWMARAMISLPVPVSPKSSTGALLRDTSRARAITAASPVSPPISRSSPARRSPSIRCSDGRRGGTAAGRIFCDIVWKLIRVLYTDRTIVYLTGKMHDAVASRSDFAPDFTRTGPCTIRPHVLVHLSLSVLRDRCRCACIEPTTGR